MENRKRKNQGITPADYGSNTIVRAKLGHGCHKNIPLANPNLPPGLRTKADDFVKNPSAALRGILGHCGVPTSTPRSFGFARLASGAFYFAVQFRKVQSKAPSRFERRRSKATLSIKSVKATQPLGLSGQPTSRIRWWIWVKGLGAKTYSP